MTYFFENRLYQPVYPPHADNLKMAHAGERLMMRHTPDLGPTIFWAKKDMLQSGWVIGVEVK